jgi:hypothetical protein
MVISVIPLGAQSSAIAKGVASSSAAKYRGVSLIISTVEGVEKRVTEFILSVYCGQEKLLAKSDRHAACIHAVPKP